MIRSLLILAASAGLAAGEPNFTIAPGLELSTAISEPDVAQPVYLTFDAKGRMWVVEYLQYPFPAGLKVIGHDEYWRVKYDNFPPPPPPHHVKGADKVAIFSDTDGDGKFETRKDFVTGLNICTAALPDNDGVWVMNPPYLLFYPDKNHDDVPDGDPVVHLAGFGMEDMHAVANSLTWGPDGWIYGCQGSTTTAKVTRPGLDEHGLAFKGQAVWRYHPPTRRFELFAEGGYNNFGIAFDRDFRVFTGSNGGIIGVHYVQGGYYQKNWGKHGPLTNPYAFGWFEGMPDRSSRAKLSQAMIVYDADALPAEYLNRMLVARVLQYRIDLCELTPTGSSYSASELRPVVSSSDHQFRPVDLKIGPDGAVYFADWNEDNVTWNVTADGHGLQKKTGQIYRLAATGKKPFSPFDYTRYEPNQLIGLLQHPNIWQRHIALQQFRDPRNYAAKTQLRELFKNGSDHPLELLWAIYLTGGFSEEVVRIALHHPRPEVREWTIRLLGDESRLQPSLITEVLASAATETDVQARSQLAASSRRWPAEVTLPLLKAFLETDRDANDPHIPMLLWWSVENKLRESRGEVFAWLAEPALWRGSIFRRVIAPRLGQRFTTERTSDNLETCADLLALAPSVEAKRQVISGMTRGLGGDRVQDVPTRLTAAIASLRGELNNDDELLALGIRLGDREAIHDAAKIVSSRSEPAERRVRFLKLLAETSEPSLVTPAIGILEEDPGSSLGIEALQALARFSDETAGAAVIKAAGKVTGSSRAKAFTIAASRPSWARQLIQALEQRQLEPRQVPLDVVLSLQKSSDEMVRQKSCALWSSARQSPAEKLQRIAALRKQIVKEPGEPKAGKSAFTLACAGCHSLFGEGGRIGPDLTGIERDNLEQLLQSIVDPSAIILPEFQGWQFTLKSDDDEPQTISGFLVEETANSVTLLDAAGTRLSIPRSNVLKREPMSISIMPEGLLDAFSPKQVNDLLAYLQQKP